MRTRVILRTTWIRWRRPIGAIQRPEALVARLNGRVLIEIQFYFRECRLLKEGEDQPRFKKALAEQWK